MIRHALRAPVVDLSSPLDRTLQRAGGRARWPMSRRRLSAEEKALWDGFVRSITPLRPNAARQNARPAVHLPQPQRPAPPTSAGAGPAPGPVQGPAPGAAPRHAAGPPLAPFERRLKQRLSRGRAPIEARIDLHGMTRNEAHAALLQFLHRAQAGGARIVLVVTGKGGRAPHQHDGERGVLRRQVPLWLELPAFRALVMGFEVAHVGHGGDGAFYVRLRRQR